MSTYGRITKTNLEDLDWIRGWNCMEPSMAGTQFGLELAQLAYDFQTEPWISAGWTDIAIQVDRRLLSGISAPEEGGDWRTMVINGLVPRVARRLRMMSNPITQVRGLKNESLLYDTGKAITLLKPLPGGRFAVAIGFSGTGRRPQDWVSNTRFGHPDKLHAGFEYLSELYHGNAEEILFPTAAKALKKESLSLRDVIAECHREDSRFTLVLSGHSQGAAVLQVWTYKRLQEGMKEPNIKGMGFACPMVASGMDASQRACPLALFVNNDDIFTRVGLREHLGRVWAFTPDAAFRRQSYGKAWEDPFIREMLGILNHVRDIDQALITMLGFLEALETVPRKEAGMALAHFIHAIMAPKWLPLAEDKTLVRTTWLVHADAEEGVDYDLDNLTTVWIKTNEQDATFCERGHLGISSPAYVPGPYAPTESQVDDFVTWYIERLKAHREQRTVRLEGAERR